MTSLLVHPFGGWAHRPMFPWHGLVPIKIQKILDNYAQTSLRFLCETA